MSTRTRQFVLKAFALKHGSIRRYTLSMGNAKLIFHSGVDSSGSGEKSAQAGKIGGDG